MPIAHNAGIYAERPNSRRRQQCRLSALSRAEGLPRRLQKSTLPIAEPPHVRTRRRAGRERPIVVGACAITAAST